MENTLEHKKQLGVILRKIVRSGEIKLDFNSPGSTFGLLKGKKEKSVISINYYPFFTGSTNDDISKKRSRKLRVRFGLEFKKEDGLNGWQELSDEKICEVLSVGTYVPNGKNYRWTFNNNSGFDIELAAEDLFLRDFEISEFFFETIKLFNKYEWKFNEVFF
tara:strand:+ start:2004 stop:2489 length:486 start_codon:yes stop_codon:yes gene_type:complete